MKGPEGGANLFLEKSVQSELHKIVLNLYYLSHFKHKKRKLVFLKVILMIYIFVKMFMSVN